MSTPLGEVVLCRFHGGESCECPQSDRERFVREGSLFEVGLQRLHYEGDCFDATITPPPAVVRALYAGLSQVIGDAPNYAETKIQTSDGKAFIVTIQRQSGKTPHELRMAAEDRGAQIVKALREVAEYAGPFYERSEGVLTCILCNVVIEQDGRQPHNTREGEPPCPIEVLDNVVLDDQGVPRRAPA